VVGGLEKGFELFLGLRGSQIGLKKCGLEEGALIGTEGIVPEEGEGRSAAAPGASLRILFRAGEGRCLNC